MPSYNQYDDVQTARPYYRNLSNRLFHQPTRIGDPGDSEYRKYMQAQNDERRLLQDQLRQSAAERLYNKTQNEVEKQKFNETQKQYEDYGKSIALHPKHSAAFGEAMKTAVPAPGGYTINWNGAQTFVPSAITKSYYETIGKNQLSERGMKVKEAGVETRQQAVDQTGQYQQDSLGLKKESIDQQGKIAEDRLAAQNAWHSDKMTIAGQRLDIQRQAQKQAAEYKDYLMAKGRQDSIVDLKDTYADIIGKIDSLKAKYSSKETYADLEKVARDYEHMIVEREKSAAQPASPAPAPIPAPEPVPQAQPPAKSKYKIIKVE